MFVKLTCILLLLCTISAWAFENEWNDVDEPKLSKKMRDLLTNKAIEDRKDSKYIMSCQKGENIAAIFCRYREILHKKYPDIELPLFLSPETANMTVDKEFINADYSTSYLPFTKLVYLVCYNHPLKLSCNGDVFLISVNEKRKKEIEDQDKNPPLANKKPSDSDPDWQTEKVAKIPENVLTIETDYVDATHCLTTIDDKKFDKPDNLDIYLRQMDKERYKNGIHLQGNDKRANEMEYAVIGLIKKFIKEHNVNFYFSVPISARTDKPFTKISKRSNDNKIDPISKK